MLRVISLLSLLGAATIFLGGCGYSDANATFVPESLRYKAPEPQIDKIPNVKAILRERGAEVFSSRAPPKNIRVSVPRRNPSGPGWTACVRADIAGITGRPIGTRTYLMTIDGNNKVGDRRLVDGASPCEAETYEPV